MSQVGPAADGPVQQASASVVASHLPPAAAVMTTERPTPAETRGSRPDRRTYLRRRAYVPAYLIRPGLKPRRCRVIDVSATRIKAFLHISSQGQLSAEIGELTDLRYADVKRAVQICEQHRDDIVGVKIRIRFDRGWSHGKLG